jgi:hypothetical protein
VPGEAEAHEPERLHHGDHHRRHGALGIGRVIGIGGGNRRPAVAWQVGDHQGEPLRKRRCDPVIDHVGLRVAVQQQQGWAFAADPTEDAAGQGVDPA